ncbi:MAG: EAL domain-containing protein [Clostridia bacterium]|jgi:diguanylate cyclase (GGDEF)-like protein|nr:EAL domain-containing protein [Clostridia bacterium]
MKKIKQEEYIKEKRYKLNIKWILTIFILIMIMSLMYVKYIKELTYKNIYKNISELSEQTAAQLNLAIEEQKKFVEIMVESIDRGYFKTTDDIFDRFKVDLEDYNFTRLVILDKNGNGTTSDGHVVENYPNMQEFFSKEDVYLSENRPSTVSDNQVNIYSKKFKFNKKELVLFATINTEDYREILLRRLFNGEGGTYLINNNGDVLIDSFDNIKENNVNIYEYMKKMYNVTNQKDINKINNMAQNIKKLEVGTFDVKINKNTYFVHYEKVNVNNWYVVTVAPDNTIANEINIFITISLGVCFLINIIIVGISIYIDISNQKQNRKLYKTAYVDPITKLGNEAYFRENGTIFLEEQEKNKYIITVDINKFKALNNIYGYETCNNILKALGNKLTKILPTDNITCRISNDVFASIFVYEKNIKRLLDKVYTNASNLKVGDISIYVNLSIGAYKISSEDKDINKVLNKSYTARSKNKGLYNENYYIFDEVLENKLNEEQKIESYMENALKNKEFKIVYQPKVFTQTGKIRGAEALVRWERDGKIIQPGNFIPLFEKNKFIVKLDLYIFEQVCKDMQSWKEKYNFEPNISINVSKEHFVNENFIEEYVKISDKYSIKRSQIDLEITESATIDENIDTLKILNSIKEKGYTISIDDFGTGYSSLSMLQNMPIDLIKIDKVFVDKADLNSDRNIINFIMLLAKRLDVKTIVEGVETEEQVEFIRKLECDIIQGYYYSKPLSKADFEDYFNKRI